MLNLVLAWLTALALLLTGFATAHSCDRAAPAGPDVPVRNLIANGGFERGLSGWQVGGCSACSTIDTSTVYLGEKSYSVDTTAIGSSSFVWQAVPADIRDFALRLLVNRVSSDNTVELVRNWDSYTGRADLISEVHFADPSTDTLRWRAWNTELVTDFVWPSDGWHELVIVADWIAAEQSLYVDGVLIGKVHAPAAFPPEHLILGDTPGIGSHARYFFDDVVLTRLPPAQEQLFLPIV